MHKAVLKDGTEVVIKVQRRNIKEKMVMDIKLLKKALKMLHVEKIIKNIVSFDEILDELLSTDFFVRFFQAFSAENSILSDKS